MRTRALPLAAKSVAGKRRRTHSSSRRFDFIMNSLFQPARTDAERRLRERIFNVLPAASFHLDRLLQLLDVVESDRSPTACIECSAQPRLHLNPEFVAEYCAEDEGLFV